MAQHQDNNEQKPMRHCPNEVMDTYPRLASTEESSLASNSNKAVLFLNQAQWQWLQGFN